MQRDNDCLLLWADRLLGFFFLLLVFLKMNLYLTKSERQFFISIFTKSNDIFSVVTCVNQIHLYSHFIFFTYQKNSFVIMTTEGLHFLHFLSTTIPQQLSTEKAESFCFIKDQPILHFMASNNTDKFLITNI